MNNDSTQSDFAHNGRALVAIFADRDSARAAIHRLHDEGFERPWLGVTKQGSSTSNVTQIESDDDGPMGAIGRFFTGESGGHPLHAELLRHGVSESAARQLDTQLPANGCVLTVDGSNHPELAAQVIEENGGHVVAGESFASNAPADAREYTTGTSALGYGDAAQTARGEAITGEQRVKLREERLTINKESVNVGEATIAKDVVSHQQDVDVPIYHEELYIERRPVTETNAPDTTPIGAGEMIRIPLMREQVQVSKRVVQTGEVAVGKRQVQDTQHIRETIREEKLVVDDAATLSAEDLK